MIMDGLEFTGEVPFHTVYLHGLIRDEHGQKMRKTKGNVIDPLIVMDEMGTDALRFTLLVGSTPGNDMNLSHQEGGGQPQLCQQDVERRALCDRRAGQRPGRSRRRTANGPWPIRGSGRGCSDLIRDVERLFANYQYGEAGRQIYDFFWSEFADWYVEIAKLQLAEGGDRAFYTASTLVRVLDACLRLLHPFTPFVTEELWGHLKQAAGRQGPGLPDFAGGGHGKQALIVARFPEPRAGGRLGRTKSGRLCLGAGGGARHPQPADRKARSAQPQDPGSAGNRRQRKRGDGESGAVGITASDDRLSGRTGSGAL